VVDLVVGGVTRVLVGSGVLDAASVLGDSRPASCAVIAQPGAVAIARTVAGALDGAGVRTTIVDIPDGEMAKTMPTVEAVCLALADAGLSRTDLLVSVGGGAASDLGGFVAAVYLRGITAHHVPTTLLGAVDAAIGGKSGIDVGGKNLVGVFRHPARVVIDLEVLGRLPDDLVREGMAEALKTALIGDPGLLELLERDGVGADLAEVVSRSLAVKARIVGRDFTEAGERAHLNYGHTVGHAIESASGISHGSAVAIGMVAAGRASSLVAGFEHEARQADAIGRLGLPVSAPALDRAAVLRLIDRDKKRDGAETRMVLLEAIGRPVVASVGSATVDAPLEAVGIPGGDS